MARTVHLIRHGQSEFNRVWDVEGRDPLIRDAPLSEVGHEQVCAAREAALALAPDVVITSPLSRAVQTTLGLFGGSGVRIEVSPLHAERVTNTDDIGSPPHVLAERFPHLDFAHLPAVWWHNGPLDEVGVPVEPGRHFYPRVESWIEAVHARPESRIVVVGHGTFFHAVLGRHLANCEISPAPLPLELR
jgi:broad specificity phosphatase PhoE